MRKAFSGPAMLVALAACGGSRTGAPASGSDANTGAPEVDAAVVPDAAPSPDAPTGPPDAPPIGACRDGWCWVYPTPQGNAVRSIWGSSATDVWAVADRSTLLHYDGASWTEHPTGGASWGSGFGALWGTGPSDVWAAVGAGGVLHWDGSAWASKATGDALAIGGTGPDDVWAYDFTGSQIWQWDASGLHTHALPAAGWRPIGFGGSPGTLLAVSNAGGIAQWLGTAWGILDVGSHPAVAAAILDATHLVLAGSGGISFWVDGAWVAKPQPPVGASWTAVAARGVDDVWVGGLLSGAQYRFHWNGTAWSALPESGDTGWPLGMWEDAGGALWAGLSDSEVRVWTGDHWDAKTSGDNYVSAVAGTAESDIWIVSEVFSATPRHRISHWNGSAWSEVDFPFGNNYTLGRMWSGAPGDVWIAAGKFNGNLIDRYLLHRKDGAWSAVGPLGQEDGIDAPTGFTSIWGASATDIYAVARRALYHYDGAGWSPVQTLAAGSDVFGTGSRDVYAIDGTALWHWDGQTWTSTQAPSALSRGWAASSTDVWLSGVFAGAHYDGRLFTTLDALANEGMPVGSSAEMFTFGFQGGPSMTRWTGGIGGTHSATPLFFTPLAEWPAPGGRVYAAGAGLLVHP